MMRTWHRQHHKNILKQHSSNNNHQIWYTGYTSTKFTTFQTQEGHFNGPKSLDYHTSFEWPGLSVQEKKFNIDLQDGGHLGFPIRTFLAVFDLQFINTSNEVSSQLTFRLKRKNQNRISTWLLWISD